MSSGVPTGESLEENAPQTLSFGPGFSVIDINTVTRSIRTSTSDVITSTSASTLSETTTFATLTRRPLFGTSSSSSLTSTILEEIESTSRSTLPTTRPPLVTSQPSPPNSPSFVIGTDAGRTDTPGPTATMALGGSDNNVPSSQNTETTGPRISTGGAVGIAIVVVVVLILFGFGIFRYLKQRKLQGLPPSSKPKKGKTPQMATMPYMANERSLEEGWESGSTVMHYPFEDTERLGLGLRGIGEQSNSSLTRLPIHR